MTAALLWWLLRALGVVLVIGAVLLAISAAGIAADCLAGFASCRGMW